MAILYIHKYCMFPNLRQYIGTKFFIFWVKACRSSESQHSTPKQETQVWMNIYIAKPLCRQNATLSLSGLTLCLWPASWWQGCAFSLLFSLSLASLPSLSTRGENPRRNPQGRQRSLRSQRRSLRSQRRNQQSRRNQVRILAHQLKSQNWHQLKVTTFERSALEDCPKCGQRKYLHYAISFFYSRISNNLIYTCSFCAWGKCILSIEYAFLLCTS